LFAVGAFGILAHEQVIGPLLITQLFGIERALDMRLTDTGKFGFIA